MKNLFLPFLLFLSSCFSSGDFFHDKVGMGQNKSHIEKYLEVELINHVDSFGRGSEDPECTLTSDCKVFYGRGTPGNSFDNQVLKVKTNSKDMIQDVFWWFKFNPNFISLQLDNVKTFPSAADRFKDEKPTNILELKGHGLPVKQFRLFWKKEWGLTKADVFCFGSEHEQVRNCHVTEYWITYKTPKDYWEKLDATLKKEENRKEIAW
jgi:hypothetical protein